MRPVNYPHHVCVGWAGEMFFYEGEKCRVSGRSFWKISWILCHVGNSQVSL